MPRQKRPSMKGRGEDLFYARDADPEAVEDVALADDLNELADEELLVFDTALDMLSRPADQQIGPRLSRKEIDTITDVIYEAHKSYGLKLTQQDIVRLGVTWLLANYREREATSVLGLFMRKRGARQQEVAAHS